MAKAVLMLGGNVGDVRQTLRQAVERIAGEMGAVLEQSSYYVTTPWGFDGADDFVNQGVVIETGLTPEQLLCAIHVIESDMGRDRNAENECKVRQGKAYASRMIDIDIILYDDTVVCSDNLVIPHPLMEERAFVLEPLAEIVPHMTNPVTGRNVNQMLAALRGKGI